jgi:hypothetical protein
MPRNGRRKIAEEMAEILRLQVERGLTNVECAVEAGLSVETVKRWRARLRVRSQKSQDPVEWVPPAKSGSELVVELPDGMQLKWLCGWDVGQVAQLVRALRSS